MKSSFSKASITFHELQDRLIQVVNARIDNGDFTERGLARILGISQPQIHNVLKGARKLRPELADRLIGILEISVLDLVKADEVQQHFLSLGSARATGASLTPAAHLAPKRFDNVPTRKRPSTQEVQRALPFDEQAG